MKPLKDNPDKVFNVRILDTATDQVSKVLHRAQKLTMYYKVDNFQLLCTGAWMAGAAVLGWQAFHMYHGDLDTDCFAGTFEPKGLQFMNTTEVANTCYTLSNSTEVCGAQLIEYGKNEAPSCNPYGNNFYVSLGVAGSMLLAYLYEMSQTMTVSMPFSTATWEFNFSMFGIYDVVEIASVRTWQYFAHLVSALGFFTLWYYIDTDSIESKALVHEANRSLTGINRAWMVIWPTCMAEITAIKAFNLNREQWREHSMGWAAMSILIKFLVMLTLHFVLDPQTQLLWLHADDSTSQRNWVIGITAFLGFAMFTFWYKFLGRRYVEYEQVEDGHTVERLQNRLWAYVDFPTSLTMVAMVAYNVTARLHHEHGNTHLPADYFAGLMFLLTVTIGIFSIPVNKMDADWSPTEQRKTGPSGSRIISKDMCMVQMKKNKPSLKSAEEVRAKQGDDNL